MPRMIAGNIAMNTKRPWRQEKGSYNQPQAKKSVRYPKFGPWLMHHIFWARLLYSRSLRKLSLWRTFATASHSDGTKAAVSSNCRKGARAERLNTITINLTIALLATRKLPRAIFLFQDGEASQVADRSAHLRSQWSTFYHIFLHFMQTDVRHQLIYEEVAMWVLPFFETIAFVTMLHSCMSAATHIALVVSSINTVEPTTKRNFFAPIRT